MLTRSFFLLSGVVLVACGDTAATGDGGTLGGGGSSDGGGGGMGAGGGGSGGVADAAGGGGSSSQDGSAGNKDATAGGGAGAKSDGSTVEAGSLPCGTKVCAPGQYCCNASCGLCAPIGAACIQIACVPAEDAGTKVDAGSYGCTADSAGDATMCGGVKPPHYYRCVFPYQEPKGCQQLTVGNATDTFCCP
jgi:hypothetical protein